MKKTIFSSQDFINNSNLQAKNYEATPTQIKFNPKGHNGQFEAVISFRSNGAIGNYFGAKYRNLFEAIESVGINPKLVRWVNDK